MTTGGGGVRDVTRLAGGLALKTPPSPPPPRYPATPRTKPNQTKPNRINHTNQKEMNTIKNMMSSSQPQQQQQQQSGGGWTDKLNGLAGGGQASEKNEDLLDKGPLPPSLSPAHNTSNNNNY